MFLLKSRTLSSTLLFIEPGAGILKIRDMTGGDLSAEVLNSIRHPPLPNEKEKRDDGHQVALRRWRHGGH